MQNGNFTSSKTLRGILLISCLALVSACSSGGSPNQAADPSDNATLQPAATDGNTETAAGGQTEDLISLSVAEAASGQGGYIFEVIKEYELDKKHGLDIEPSALSFTEAATVLGQGEVEVGLIQPSTLVNLAQEGVELEQIAPVLWSGNAFVTPSGSTISSMEDMEGSRIGNFSPVTGAYFFSSVLAAAAGLDIDEDFEQVTAETGALIALLERGDVQAINMFEPHVTKLVSTGDYRVAIDFDSAFLDRYGSKPIKNTLGASQEWIADNPEAVARLQDTIQEAASMILAGEDEELFREIGADWFGLEGQEQIDAAFERNRNAYVSPEDWTQEMADAQTVILEDGIELGLLPDAEESVLDMWGAVVGQGT